MVQILPRVPGFGEKLIGSLSGAAEDVIGGLQQKAVNDRDQKILETFGDPTKTPMEYIQAFSKLSTQRQQALSPLVTQLLKSQQPGKAQIAQEEKEQVKKNLAVTLDELEEKTPYVGTQAIPFTKNFEPSALVSPFLGPMGSVLPNVNRKAVQERELIDSQGFWATDQTYTHFNKGTVSDAKLQLMKKDLAPHSGLSERAYKARIQALRRISNLPSNVGKEKFEAVLNKEIKAVKENETEEDKKSDKAEVKVEKNAELTPQVIDQFLDEANGDPKKAKVLAKKAGYKF